MDNNSVTIIFTDYRLRRFFFHVFFRCYSQNVLFFLKLFFAARPNHKQYRRRNISGFRPRVVPPRDKQHFLNIRVSVYRYIEILNTDGVRTSDFRRFNIKYLHRRKQAEKKKKVIR